MHKYLWAIRQQCESNRQTKPIIIIEISKIKTTSRVCFVHVEHEYEQASHMLQCVSVSSVQSETLGREWRNIHMHHSSGIFRLLSLTFQFQSIIITGKNNKKTMLVSYFLLHSLRLFAPTPPNLAKMMVFAGANVYILFRRNNNIHSRNTLAPMLQKQWEIQC